jgi:integrase/recombinase XerD
MALTVSEALPALLEHYHARLLAAPETIAKLDHCGVVSPDMVVALRLGVVDRTALRTLAPRRTEHGGFLRQSWMTAGLLLPNGRERFRGCLVIPCPQSADVLAVRLNSLARPRPDLLTTQRNEAAIILRDSLQQNELVCAADPLDALALWRIGYRHVIAPITPSVATHGHPQTGGFAESLRATAPLPIRLIAAGTTVGRLLVEQLSRIAKDQHRELRVTVLPLGCAVRDLNRLMGASLSMRALRFDEPLLSHSPSQRQQRRAEPAPLPWQHHEGTLATALTAYVEFIASSGRANYEIKRCVRALEQLRLWLGNTGATCVNDVSADSLTSFQRTLIWRDRECDSHRSINKCRRTVAIVHGFVAWAVRRGLLTTDPRIGVAPIRRVQAVPPDALSEDEVEHILTLTQPRTAMGVRDRTMLELLYASGIRRAELVGLDVGDVDVERGLLRVRRGKGGTSRLVPMGRRARRWLVRYVEEARVRALARVDEPALFLTWRGRRITSKMVTARMRARIRAAGITKSGSCHIFRHSAATHMHDGGADLRDLQVLLGHASITSTQLYTRVSMQRLLAVHARTHPSER